MLLIINAFIKMMLTMIINMMLTMIINMMLVITMKQYHQVLLVIAISVYVNGAHH